MVRCVVVLLIAVSWCCAAEKRSERWYQEQAASMLDGRMEAAVENGRVDILTATHAIEVEFARNWKNSIGQALWYAMQTNKRAAIILILENPQRDRSHTIRLGSVVQSNHLPIDVWLWPDDFLAPR